MSPGIDDFTGRNRSSAVSPTSSRARCWFFTPGSCTITDRPWRAMSGSATPSASTRLRMISIVSFRASSVTSLVGWRTTDTPPWRSRPSWGVVSVANTAARAPMATTTMKMRGAICLRRMRGATLPVGRGHRDRRLSRVPASTAARADSTSRSVHHTLWIVRSRGAVGSSTIRRCRR